jgi:chitin synthase
LNRRRDDEGEVKTEDLELDRVGLDNDNDISQYYETISIHTESSQTNPPKGKTSDSITRDQSHKTFFAGCDTSLE